MKIMAFDPGGVTGWAVFEFDVIQDSPRWKRAIRDHFRSDKLGVRSSREEHHQALWTLLIREHPDIVICERFDNRGNEFAKLISKEYIGVVKLYCILFGIKLVMQGSDQAKNFSDDGKLIMLGVHRLPAVEMKDVNDALRHLVYFLANVVLKGLPSVRLIILEALRSES
jgi:hypothetical protein